MKLAPDGQNRATIFHAENRKQTVCRIVFNIAEILLIFKTVLI